MAAAQAMVAIGVVALGLIVVFAVRVILALFAGVLFAVALRGAARGLARLTRLPYWAALGTIVLAGLAGTAAAAVFLAPSVGEQFERFARDLPQAIEQVRERLGHAPLVDSTLGKTANPTAAKVAPQNLSHMAVAALGGTFEVLGGLIVVFFIGVYGAAQPGVYVRAALGVTPRRYREHVNHALEATAHNLTRWLLGRSVAMLFVGVATSIAFHFLRVPLALLLGVLAGLLTFVEYAGAIASAIPPVLLGLAQSPAVGLAVVVLYTVVHVVEGYVLTPLLSRASVHLPPAITLATQVLLGTFAGVLGLTFSTPLLVVGVSVVTAWREENLRAR